MTGSKVMSVQPISREFVRLHRSEQMAGLRAILRSPWKFSRIDPFRVAAK